MKITILKSIIGVSVALAVVAGTWTPLQAADQVKGAAKLIQKSAAATEAAVMPAAMSCAKCASVPVRYESTVKGHIKTVTLGEKHLCPSCSTSLTVTGAGKAATTVAVHTCKAGAAGADSCATR